MILFERDTDGNTAYDELDYAKKYLCDGRYPLAVKCCGKSLTFILCEYMYTVDKGYARNNYTEFLNKTLLDHYKDVASVTDIESLNTNGVDITYINSILAEEAELEDEKEATLIYEYAINVYKYLTSLLLVLELENGVSGITMKDFMEALKI